MLRNFFPYKVQCGSSFRKSARKVSGLSRNAHQASSPDRNYKKNPRVSVKRRLGVGAGVGVGVGVSSFVFVFVFVFFQFPFFCDLLGTRLLLDGKVCVGLQRKILLKKLRNKWNCACDKLPSVGSFSHENGHVRHVVNHFRVFLL